MSVPLGLGAGRTEMNFESTLSAGRHIVEKAAGGGLGRKCTKERRDPPAADVYRREHDGPYTECPWLKASHEIITFFAQTGADNRPAPHGPPLDRCSHCACRVHRTSLPGCGWTKQPRRFRNHAAGLGQKVRAESGSTSDEYRRCSLREDPIGIDGSGLRLRR